MKEAIFHVANDPAKFRPGLTNNFRVTIYGLEGIADITNEEEGAKLGEDTELVLKIANEDFQEPNLNQQSVTITRGNLKMEFPAQMDAFQSTSKFTCFVDSDAYGKLYAWKMLSGNHENGDVGNPQDYWKEVIVEHLDGKGNLLGTWFLHNCWISSLQGITFSNNQAEVKTCQVTLKYFKPQWRKA